MRDLSSYSCHSCNSCSKNPFHPLNPCSKKFRTINGNSCSTNSREIYRAINNFRIINGNSCSKNPFHPLNPCSKKFRIINGNSCSTNSREIHRAIRVIRAIRVQKSLTVTHHPSYITHHTSHIIPLNLFLYSSVLLNFPVASSRNMYPRFTHTRSVPLPSPLFPCLSRIRRYSSLPNSSGSSSNRF